ncbi:MAG TPA: class I SAM-dependent methyltransferase, partial [Roseiflexaceae bacterium]|nr:class I SAM-dependent methyltransferase [Roseiflexaceae bacterium]
PPPAGACRLVFAESDGLPGLIVDRYGGFLVVQFLTQGMAVRADAIVALLAELVQPLGIYERGDADVREKEGLPRDDGVRWGQAPPPQLTIVEGARRLLVDLCGGQKTGSYLDQAQNRDRVAAYCRGAEVLDCFCYTGGFTIAAATDAATVEAVDSSASALAMLGDNLAQNQHTAQVAAVEGDVFKMLRQYRHEGRSFDVVILDPPKFAHSHGQIERAARGYKDINLIAMQILRPGGVLASFSCSGLIGPDLFQKILFGAAVDARRDVQILERLTQAADHPLLLTFPEGEYLKGLICRVW